MHILISGQPTLKLPTQILGLSQEWLSSEVIKLSGQASVEEGTEGT